MAGVQIRRATEEDAAAIALAHVDSIRAIGPSYYRLELVEAWVEGLTADVYTRAMQGGEAFFIATGDLDGQNEDQPNPAAGTSTRIVTTDPIGGAPSVSCDACSV